ncbi:MAG TPA: OmpA family protein [Haliangium sp.]|nr:OmpA family protein [Haliangium sp.]
MHTRHGTQPSRLYRTRALAGAGALLGTSLALLGNPAHAQEMTGADVPLERFRLATDAEGVLDVDWADVPNHLDWDLALWFDMADDPLVAYRDEDGDRERIGSLVSRRVTTSVLASIALWDRVQLGLEVPLVLSQDGDSIPIFMLDEPSNVGLGDIRLMPKVQILDADSAGVHLAFLPSFTLPTGTGDNYGNEAGLAFVPELLASRAFGAFRVSSGLGYLARKDTQLVDLDVEDELFLRLGFGYRLSENGGPPLELDASLSGATAAPAPFDAHNQNHVELRAGASYRIAGPVVGILAGGLGVREGFGTPDWRGVLGVRLSPERALDMDRDGIPDADDGCPLEAEDRDVFEDKDGCPDPDNDKDGVLDASDGAPNDPEDGDGFEDGDGVPDPDNDKDGIADAGDACPIEAETANSFQDDDGCPDQIPDVDGDGIADDKDKCPEVAEDVDAFEDDDGCADPDNDKDGVLDAADRCVSEAGPAANRGCPDTDRDSDTVVDRLDNCPDQAGEPKKQGCPTDQGVRIGDGKLELLDNVHFATNQDRILPRSLPLLRNAARVLAGHPEITRVRVEGHTDDRGDDTKNLDLSQRRAQAVVAFLIEQGIAADRLEAQGFGETKPIVPNTTAPNRAKNRRVELHIVDK